MQQDQSDKLDKLFTLVQGMQQDMQGMQQDMQGMQQDMQGMQQDLQGVQGQIQGIQQGMQGMQSQIQGLEQTMQKMYGEMNRGFDKVNARLDQKADKKDIDHILSMLDHETKQHEIDEHERLAMGAQLDRHETRIEKLEQQVATA